MRLSLTLAAPALLALAACGSGTDDAEVETTTQNTIVDEDYDANAPTLDEQLGELGEEENAAEQSSAAPPAPQPTTEIDESDVMVEEEPETEDVVGL